jgi:hypothetical protein
MRRRHLHNVLHDTAVIISRQIPAALMVEPSLIVFVAWGHMRANTVLGCSA